MGFSKTFDIDLQRGQVAERMLRELLGDSRVEVKRDFAAGVTGNVCVEYRYRGQPSGIASSTAQWWCFVLSGDQYEDEIIVMVKTERLRRLLKKNKRRFRHTRGGDDSASKIVLLPLCALFTKD